MSLFDGLLSSVLGEDGRILAGVVQLVQENGGVEGLLNLFKEAGLGDVVSSWLAQGENLPISPEQILEVLGSEQVTKLAESFGVDAGRAGELLSEFLPKAVDQLSPNGEMPQGGDLMSQGLDMLKGFLK